MSEPKPWVMIGGPQDGLFIQYPPKIRDKIWLHGIPGNKTIYLGQNQYGELHCYTHIGDGRWQYTPNE